MENTIVKTTRAVDAPKAYQVRRGAPWTMYDQGVRMLIPAETYGVAVGKYGGYVVVCFDIETPWDGESIWMPTPREKAEGKPFLVPAEAISET